MDMSQLQQLVRRFIENEIAYPAFHADFVQQYLYARHADAVMDDLVNEIEGICADLDAGDISEPELRDDLSVIARAPLVSIELAGQLRINLPISIVSGKPSRKPNLRESGSSNRAVVRELQHA